MFVRTAALLALLVAIQGAPSATTVPAPKAAKAAPTIRVAFRVEYRTAGSTAWTIKSAFRSEAAARAEMNALYEAGHDARMTRAETFTMLRTPAGTVPAPASALSGGISVVSYAQATQAFRAAAARGDIAFRYPTDGCYARAYLMGVQMQRAGLKPGKAWAFDDAAFGGGSPRLVASTTAHPRGYVSWKYHVAPALKVRTKDGKVVTCVIDPSLFDKPVSLAAWQKRMMPGRVGFTPRLDVTAWGQAPRDGKGARMAGTGYWPGKDPASLLRSAREVMAMYKPHEGTDWSPARRTAVASRSLGSARDTTDDLSAIPAREFADKHLLDLPAR